MQIHKDGTNDADFNEIIVNTNKLYPPMNSTFIRRKEISSETRKAVYNIIFKPTRTYG